MTATTQTDGLVEWLLQQVAADESVAYPQTCYGCVSEDNCIGSDPRCGERILRECEAKRRLIRQARAAVALSDATPDDGTPASERIHGAATAWEYALDALAAVYSDRPGYRQEWKP